VFSCRLHICQRRFFNGAITSPAAILAPPGFRRRAGPPFAYQAQPVLAQLFDRRSFWLDFSQPVWQFHPGWDRNVDRHFRPGLFCNHRLLRCLHGFLHPGGWNFAAFLRLYKQNLFIRPLPGSQAFQPGKSCIFIAWEMPAAGVSTAASAGAGLFVCEPAWQAFHRLSNSCLPPGQVPPVFPPAEESGS